MKKVLWISQFAPLNVQVESLQKKYGSDCVVIHRNIINAEQVVKKFRQGSYVDIACVLPLAALEYLCNEGIHPLWAEMQEKPLSEGQAPDLTYRGKRFWFAGFKRLRGVSLELVNVEPKPIQRVLRVTRHPMKSEEKSLIVGFFGEHVEVIENSQPVKDGRDVLTRMQRARAEEVLLVAPLSVYDQLVKMGTQPLFVIVANGVLRSLQRVVGLRMEFDETNL